MSKLSITYRAILSVFFSFQAHAITLQNVFDVCPPLAEFRPGPYALHTSLSEATVKIDGRFWEVRYATYTDTNGITRHRTLQELASDYGFAKDEGKPFEVNPMVTTITWSASEKMKGQGIYYVISVKPLELNLECIECENGHRTKLF